MTTSVSWTAIADTVAKVKEDHEKVEAQLIFKPLADSEPATVDECSVDELTLKVPGAASTKPDPVHHRHRLCGKPSLKQIVTLGTRFKKDPEAHASKSKRFRASRDSSATAEATPKKPSKKELMNSAIPNIDLQELSAASPVPDGDVPPDCPEAHTNVTS